MFTSYKNAHSQSQNITSPSNGRILATREGVTDQSQLRLINMKTEPKKRKTYANERFLHLRQFIILTILLKTDNGLIAIVLLINYSLCFFPKGNQANFAK